MAGVGRQLCALVSFAAALAVTLCGAPSQAQQPAPQQEQRPKKDESLPPGSEAAADEVLRELLLQGDLEADDDLRWLYSDAEEYAPSGLVGKPIPARGLPERGEGSARTWNPRWKRFSVGNYILTGVALTVAGASFLIPESPNRWRGKNGLDESVRDAIGIEDYESGQWSRDLSDVGLSVAVSYPLLVDSLIVTFWYRRSNDVAGQMALITGEALSVTAAVQGLTSGLTSRERPYGRNCDDPETAQLDDCAGNTRYKAFYSGHTAMSFAGAAVSCSHHIHHDVFGDPVADGISCGAGFLTAGVVGTMRIVGDRHYFSDAAMGAAAGTLTGFGLPWLLHYGPLAAVSAKSASPHAVRLSLVPSPGGLGVGGKF